jgi:subtilisin family serine protease
MFRRFLSSLFGPTSRHGSRVRIRGGRALAIEPLEDRSVPSASYAPGEVLVQFTGDAGEALRTAVRSRVGGVLANRIEPAAIGSAEAGSLDVVKLPAGLAVADAIRALQGLPGVRFAEPNWVVTTQVVSNDTYYENGSLWGMYSDDLPTSIGPTGTTNPFGTQAEKVWAAGNTGSRSVLVGVIDEGLDFHHPDLAANIWSNPFDPVDGIDNDGNGYADDTHGWDFYQNNNTIYDGSPSNLSIDEHGTHVAGTIGAVGGNGAGVAGMNWQVQMISGKFLGPNGGYISDAIDAENYFVHLKTLHPELNIVALNNSWGGGGYSQAMQDAITRATNANILFIAAAGNGGYDQVGDNNDAAPFYPASYNNTIAVAAIDSSGRLAPFSNYGATSVDLAAPGVGILSTTPNGGYISYSGTSMATPHVTGAAALFAAANPGATAQQIRDAILDSARRTPTASLAGRTATGGRLNVSLMAPAANDIAITNVVPSASSVDQGQTITVDVTVQNAGTQAVASDITVTLRSDNGTGTTTDDFTIGTLPIPGGLAAGTATTLTFTWNTNATPEGTGFHTLTATHNIADEVPGNDSATARVTVIDPNAPDTPLYLTVSGAGTVNLGGLAVQDEDIVLYQNGVYSLFFDGTPDLGGSSGGFAIDAFSVVNENELLVSVDQFGWTNQTGLTVYDEDIIRYTRSGSTAPWVASMYFDGSDVGLSTGFFAGANGAEGVDAIERLPDGRILVSTKGNFSVSGVSGTDEDVIAFTPTRLGSTTSGTWAMYFDGSQFGLGDGGENEDVDGISVDANGRLYLSTKGAFNISLPSGSLAGSGSDVFYFAPGNVPTLYLAGITFGGANVSSIDLPPAFAPSSASSQAAPAESSANSPSGSRGGRGQAAGHAAFFLSPDDHFWGIAVDDGILGSRR